MKYALTSLYVADMEKALSFYEGLLGISVLRRVDTPGGELVFLGEEGKPNLELVAQQGPVAYGGYSIGFEVEDLAGLKRRLAQAGYETHREFQPGPGTTLCFVKGPGGEEVELIAYAK